MWVFGRISNVITESSTEPRHTMAGYSSTCLPVRKRLSHGRKEELKVTEEIISLCFSNRSIHQRKSSWKTTTTDPQLTALSNFTFRRIAATAVRAGNGLALDEIRMNKFTFPATNKTPVLLLRTTVRGGQEGTDRTRFLWRKPSETEAHLHVAPLVGISMSWLSGPVPRYKVSSQNQGLSVVGHPPSQRSGGSHWEAEKGPGLGDPPLSFWAV